MIIIFLFLLPFVESVIPLMAIGMMGQMGVFKSHKDRRRKQDNIPPCESSDPLDTADDDCYTARWNLMVGYFPAHLGLKRMDNKVVQGEAEVEAVWNHISRDLEKISPVMYGTGGTSSKHSTTDGVVHLVKHISGATKLLANAANAGTKWMTDQLNRVTNDSGSDLRRLGDNIQTGIDAMWNGTEQSTARLEGSVRSKEDMMNMHASSALRAQVADLVEQERVLSNSVVNSQDMQAKYQASFTVQAEKVSQRDANLASRAETLNTSLPALGSTLLDLPVRAAVDSLVDQTAEEFQGSKRNVEDRASQIVSVATDDSCMHDLNDELGKLIVGTYDDTMAKVMNLTDLMDARLAVTTMLPNVSIALSNSTSIVRERARSWQTVTRDLDRGISKVSFSASAGIDSIKAESDQVVRDAQNQASVAQKKLALWYLKRLPRSPLIDALMDAQGAAIDGLSPSEASDKINAILKQLGSQSGGIAAQTDKLQQSAAQATTEAGNKVDAQAVALDAQLTSQDGSARVLAVGYSLDQASLSVSKSMREDTAVLGTELAETQQTVEDQLSQINQPPNLPEVQTNGMEQAAGVAGAASQLTQLGRENQVEIASLAKLNLDERPLDSLATAVATQDDRLAVSLSSLDKIPPPRAPGLDRGVVRSASQSLAARERDSDSGDRQADKDHMDGQLASVVTNTIRLNDRMSTGDERWANVLNQKQNEFLQALALLISRESYDQFNRSINTLLIDNPLRLKVPVVLLSSANEETRSNKTADLLAVLTNKLLGEMVFNPDLLQSIQKVIAGMEGVNHRFVKRVSEINNTFHMESANISELLSNFLFNLSATLVAVPDLFTDKLVRAKNDALLAGRNLAARTNLVREQLAVTDNAAQRTALLGDLTVLSQLVNLSSGSSFLPNASSGPLDKTRESIGSISSALAALPTSRGDAPGVAGMAATLLTGMSRVGTTTASSLVRGMEQDISDSQYDLGFANNKRRMGQLAFADSAAAVDSALMRKVDASLGHARDLGFDISALAGINANRTILESLRSVLFQVTSAADVVAAAAAASEDSVSTQLLLQERLAAAVLKVWQARPEYSFDVAEATQLEADMATRIISDTLDLESQNMQVRSLMNKTTSVSPFESDFSTALADLVNKTYFFHNRKNEESVYVERDIGNIGNMEKAVSESSLNTIQSLLSDLNY